ncbi:P-loop containing nucleoside triphosphate hydrolase protein [Dendrothele bispora CBS 962.96]|uniref:P-loop containing nucleoside triphosphate hydrolase protein n=1 Tax=Dendrothele bispora (strain CBS 962.96) TaxID=1314807 RepID=A0A4S8LUN8_DENBC|nr:P-loop containing nucleoside triphosphate hydrolase protein [Dendrothele bispora CBS 962.96]
MFPRFFSSSIRRAHENPLGLPRNTPQAPQIPRRSTGPIAPRKIPNVKHVVLVSSCKGGVGKSTIAANLAISLALSSRLHVGILDLDIFGPSIPTLMGLRSASEPELTQSGALRPITNHSIPTMSMAYLLPPMPPNLENSEINTSGDTPVVWRGLMVQKAVQQLLFQVDWTGGEGGPGLDVLVVDLPPGTGDIPLSLGQLVVVDGTVIVSTPQDVALADVRRGVSMFRKLNIPLTGLVLNQSYFLCPSCTSQHHLYGSPTLFRRTASSLQIPILAELPLVSGVSEGGDGGVPYALTSRGNGEEGKAGEEWKMGMKEVARRVWEGISEKK